MVENLVGETLVERYRIERPIGSGGMGMVFLAEHVVIHKTVAIKVLHSRNKAEIERFLHEARAASRIRHENIVDITDFGITKDGLAFLVMEFLDGEDLATTSEREGALPWHRAVRIALQICRALEAAHAQGVIHRDMKPENCFRIQRGDNADYIKVLDFGIAKIIDENYDPDQPSSTASGLLGTPEYVAPELVRGLLPDARVDIYAVGVILYRLLTGKVPFLGDNFMATLTAHLMEPPKPMKQAAPEVSVPAELEAVVVRALAKDRDHRYATISEMIAALDAAVATIVGTPRDNPRRRSPLVWVFGAALLLLGAASVAYLLLSPRSDPPPVVAADLPPPAATPPLQPQPLQPPPTTPPADAPSEPPPEPEPDAPPLDPSSDPVETAKRPASAKKKKAAKLEPLTALEFNAAMSRLELRVKSECSSLSLRKMAVTMQVVVEADGRIKSAYATGAQAGSSLGNCVAKVVKPTRLRPAPARSTHTYTFKM